MCPNIRCDVFECKFMDLKWGQVNKDRSPRNLDLFSAFARKNIMVAFSQRSGAEPA